jgi:hypothetical protein
MGEQSSSSKRIQWKWVAITFVLYVLFYLFPLFVIVPLLKGAIVTMIVGAWVTGGIIIVAAVAAYLSEGVTIVEPAIAGALMVILLFFTMSLYMVYTHPGVRFDITHGMPFTVGTISIVFALSLLGAWLGERAQKLWKSKSSK